MQFFPTAEGRVDNTVVSGVNNYNYVYQYKDHLGNVRMNYIWSPPTFSVKGSKPGVVAIMDENHYYPFGLQHQFYNTTYLQWQSVEDELVLYPPISTGGKLAYNYKFGGKELQEELGFQSYDFGARNYDPALGRWMNIDPKAEISRRSSPYIYCYNNPLRFTDPDGMIGEDTFKVDISGNITKIDNKQYFNTKGEEVDKLIAGDPKYNKDGDLKNDNIDVKKGVLENMKPLRGIDVEGNKITGFELDFKNDYENAKDTFEFIAQNTKVEFSFITASSPNNTDESVNELFTSHEEKKEIFGGLSAERSASEGKNVRHNHSHPITSEGLPSPADLRMRNKVINTTKDYKFNNPDKIPNQSKFNIYYDLQYYPY